MIFSNNSSVLKPLSIRTLLEVNEDLLRENGFKDFWSLQKHKESSIALANFTDRIVYLDSIEDFYFKWFELAKGILAGNVFDWGSGAVTNILETKNDFNFTHALDTIEERPWFRDDLDKWTQRIRVCVKSPKSSFLRLTILSIQLLFLSTYMNNDHCSVWRVSFTNRWQSIYFIKANLNKLLLEFKLFQLSKFCKFERRALWRCIPKKQLKAVLVRQRWRDITILSDAFASKRCTYSLLFYGNLNLPRMKRRKPEYAIF